MFDFSDIKIKLVEKDLRAIRPDTIDDKVDDAVEYWSTRLVKDLYAIGRPDTSIQGLAAWL